jgi:phospholipase/carboxylesterase
MGDVLQHGADPATAKALCVFVHGRGQSPEAMVDLVVRHLPQDIAYALPRAPGGSWYAARAIDPLTDTTRAELTASLAHLERTIAAMRKVSTRPLLLAGFSQGACLSLELAFSGRTAPDAVAALTGCRVGLAGDGRMLALPPGLPVYLTGGSADPWIPVAAFADAAADLGAQGAAVRADVFPGRPHAVSAAEITMLAAMLGDLAAACVPRMEAPR